MGADGDTLLHLVLLLAGGSEAAAELEQGLHVHDVLGLVHEGLQVTVFAHLERTDKLVRWSCADFYYCATGTG